MHSLDAHDGNKILTDNGVNNCVTFPYYIVVVHNMYYILAEEEINVFYLLC